MYKSKQTDKRQIELLDPACSWNKIGHRRQCNKIVDLVLNYHPRRNTVWGHYCILWTYSGFLLRVHDVSALMKTSAKKCHYLANFAEGFIWAIPGKFQKFRFFEFSFFFMPQAPWDPLMQYMKCTNESKNEVELRNQAIRQILLGKM